MKRGPTEEEREKILCAIAAGDRIGATRTMSLSLGPKSEVSSGGCSTKDANLLAKASTISAEVIPNESSLGTSKGSLKRLGELHLNVLLSSTSLAVDSGMYLKKLVRSWRRFGERGIWLPSGLVQRILE